MEKIKKSGLKTRLVTGVIFIVAVCWLIFFNSFTASILLLIIAALCTFEYSNIVRKGIKDPTFNLTMLAGVGPIILSMIKPELAEGYEFMILMISFTMLMTFSVSTIILKIRTNHHLLSPLIALIYIGLPMATVSRLLIYGETYLETVLIGIMISLWISDTGAYVVGRLIGRTPLHKRISPKKTVEGWLGAGVITVASALLLVQFFPELNSAQWLTIMLAGWIAGSWGDLYESSIKRMFEVKDSGKMLPGHGGFLDRFDSFIFAAPATILLLFGLFEM